MTAPPALPAPVADAVRRDIATRVGRIALWSAGDGPPMLLVHSINAAASVYEVRPIFERMRRTHRVYAPDLPGFGASERGDRPYSVAMYVAAIEASLDAIAADVGAAPVDRGAHASCQWGLCGSMNGPHRFAAVSTKVD